MSRSELTLLLFVLVVVAFLFWTRNVIVRVPGVPTPISGGALVEPGGAVIVAPVTDGGVPPSRLSTTSGGPCESREYLSERDRGPSPAQKLPTSNVARVASNPVAQRRTGSVG